MNLETRKRGFNEKTEISSALVGGYRRLSQSAGATAATRVASSAASSFFAAVAEVTRRETALRTQVKLNTTDRTRTMDQTSNSLAGSRPGRSPWK